MGKSFLKDKNAKNTRMFIQHYGRDLKAQELEAIV